MAARTHAQQAVPTTFGATLATLLAQFTRQRERLAQAAPRIALVSLFGAGGTAAALGPRSAEVRATVADLLALHHTDVPWHVDRDGVAEFGWLCATVTATCAKLARNVVDLSRTEIGEVFEPFESHRGASSTMPQKVNPISSEIVIGLAGTAGALTSSLARLQEAGHERAAGEWQIEWQVVPQLAVLAGTALAETLIIVKGLRVDAERMRANPELDGGLAMAEAQMISLAEAMGREHAHDLVYEAAIRARTTGRTLAEVLPEVADEKGERDMLPTGWSPPTLTSVRPAGSPTPRCAAGRPSRRSRSSTPRCRSSRREPPERLCRPCDHPTPPDSCRRRRPAGRPRRRRSRRGRSRATQPAEPVGVRRRAHGRCNRGGPHRPRPDAPVPAAKPRHLQCATQCAATRTGRGGRRPGPPTHSALRTALSRRPHQRWRRRRSGPATTPHRQVRPRQMPE